jgi:hypothetical protein
MNPFIPAMCNRTAFCAVDLQMKRRKGGIGRRHKGAQAGNAHVRVEKKDIKSNAGQYRKAKKTERTKHKLSREEVHERKEGKREQVGQVRQDGREERE